MNYLMCQVLKKNWMILGENNVIYVPLSLLYIVQRFVVWNFMN